MRMMYVLPSEGFGGAERQGVLHIRSLARWGIDLVPVIGAGAPMQNALQAYGFTSYQICHEFPQRTHRKMNLAGNLLFGADYATAFFRASNRLEDIARAANVDLIFAGRTFGWAVAARAAHRLGIPYIIRAGSRPTSAALLLAVRSFCARYGPPAALLSNCKAVESSIIDALNCPGSILPNGVDTQHFDFRTAEGRLRQRLGLAGRPVVGLAARPAPEKGMEVFADTVKATCRTTPEAVFLIAGEFGWRAYYERRFTEMGLADHVRFLGHIDDMPDFFASCDVVVLTSPERSIEGSPNALLEAMAMARPVVASEVGGIPEIVDDGETGFLVNPEEPGDFARHIVELLQDPEKARRMGRAGRSRIMARHSERAAMMVLVASLRRYGGAIPEAKRRTGPLSPPDRATERGHEPLQGILRVASPPRKAPHDK